jgi:signal transduction histidine kinase
VTTTDRPATAPPGPGDRAPGHAGPASRRAGWWRGWFVPAGGLRPWALDVLLALVVALVQVAGTIGYSHDEPSPWPLDGFAFALLVAGPAALPLRRRWPEATLAVAFAAAAGYVAAGYPRGPAGFPAFAFALVSAIMMGRRAFAWCVLAVAYPAFVGLPSLLPDEIERARSFVQRAVNLAWWLPLVAAGSEIARIWLERRAEQARVAREEARRRASEERLLIARELHDVLAHNISLINVQSGVALHLLDERPEQARPALEAINEASEEALAELRSVIDVLSRGLGGQGHGESEAWAPRAPTAGLRDLDGLVRRTRAAGLDVQLTVEGEARPVPAGVGLAAFRVVQEALTNVVRHAGGDARATVRLVYAPAELVVRVDDDGKGVESAFGRHLTDSDQQVRWSADQQVRWSGIVGMRERVHALDGTFTAAPRPGRGFRVQARFPLRNQAR